MYETVGLVEVGEDEDQPADGGRVQRILELREIQDQLQIQLCDVFELMRMQSLSEEEQRAAGGVWLGCQRDQLQRFAGAHTYRGDKSAFGIIDFWGTYF